MAALATNAATALNPLQTKLILLYLKSPKIMKRTILSLAMLVAGIISLSAQNHTMPAVDRSESEELRTNMRKLWEDHVTWTRNVILCIMDDLPGADQAVERLLKNQDDIGNAIKPVYGDDAGNKLTTLLRTHITQAADLLKAAKKNDKVAFDQFNKKWFENADEISAFLSKANPNWKLNDMKNMMHDHLTLTTEEAVARQKKDYKADVAAYDKVHDEILAMADMLSDGIIKQFPDKFAMAKKNK
jgi:hypothetical protein